MDSTDLAWAAGLFEGEGCIYFNQRKGRAAALSLTSSDEDVIQRFREIVMCGSISYHRPVKAGWKPTWQWNTGRAQDVLELLDAFWPYLGKRRRDKAMEAIERSVKVGDGPTAPLHLREWRAQWEVY